jgi:hypothetical protein
MAAQPVKHFLSYALKNRKSDSGVYTARLYPPEYIYLRQIVEYAGFHNLLSAS